MGAGLNCLDSAFAGGADPTGSADSTAAINAALAACTPGQAAYLPAGTYQTTSPIVIPPYAGLTGSPATASIGTVTSGSVIVPSASFTAGTWPVAAVILVVDQVTGGFATTSEEEHVSDLMIQGTSLPGSSDVIGIALYSGGSAQISRVSLRNLLINGMTGWGYSDAGSQAEVHVRPFNVNIRGCGTNNALNAGGFNVHASDSEWSLCAAYNCYGDAWYILDSFDSAFGQCHAEHSTAGYGFHYKADRNNSSADAGGITFDNCTIDGGAQHGWFIESTSTALPPVTITGGYVRRPGSSGTYAAVCVDGYFGPVAISNMQVYPGQPDGGGGNFPAYALQLSSNGPKTNVSISGGTWIGTTAFLDCDGSQGLLTVGPDVTFGAGISTAATIWTPGVTLQATGTELVPVDRVLGMQQSGCLATTHDRGFVTASFSPSSGIPYWHLVTLVAGVPVANVNTWVTGTAKGGGSHGWSAIASVATGTSGTIVACSADQTDPATTWGTPNANVPVALTSAWTPPVTGPYWMGASVTASTMPTLGAVTNSPVTNIAGAFPVYCGSSASQSAPPSTGATIVISPLAADDFYTWAS